MCSHWKACFLDAVVRFSMLRYMPGSIVHGDPTGYVLLIVLLLALLAVGDLSQWLKDTCCV